jgi:hypothetical protein
MSAHQKKRLVVVAAGTLAAVLLYIAAYFACVSVEVSYHLGIDGPVGAKVHAYYRVGSTLQDLATWIFEPAQLCDSYYFRPRLWNEPKWKGKVLPLERDIPIY